MPHVVARHLRASSATTHQARMHRPEATKIDALRNVVRLRNLLQMPKDIPPFRRRPLDLPPENSAIQNWSSLVM